MLCSVYGTMNVRAARRARCRQGPVGLPPVGL